MTLQEYHAHPAVSRSRLWLLNDSPEKFKYQLDNPTPPTPAMVLGAAFHKLALEPESFGDEYAIAPVVNRRTNEGKAAWAAFEETANGKTIISEDELNTIGGMCNALLLNPTTKYLLQAGRHEHSIFWVDKQTGEEVKCRPDILIAKPDLKIIVDLKSTANAETEAFTRDCLKYGYAMQAAMYIEGVKSETPGEYAFIFIAVEKNPPYSVNVMEMDSLMVDYGKYQYHDLLGIYHECKTTGNWYGYNGKKNTMNRIELPAWVK